MSAQKIEENRIIRKVTLIGAVIDGVLGIAKIITGIMANSHALVADGIHSLSDLGTDALVILVSRNELSVADDNHPYGHDRIQTFAAVVLATLMILVAIGIAYDSVMRLFDLQSQSTPGFLAIFVAAVSMLAKEAIYRYTARAAKQIQSKLLLANAWHSRSDAFSSFVVLLAVGGSIAGIPWADTVGALLVAALIVKIAWEIGHEGIQELVDTGLNENQLIQMMSVAKQVDGVTDVHDLRTRRMGSSVLADMHIHVAPKISVSEGHRIGDEVYKSLRKQLPHVSDAVIHVDSEDDEAEKPSAHLPLRTELESHVYMALEPIVGSCRPIRMVIHYHAGEIELELVFAEDSIALLTAEQRAQMINSIEQIETIHRVAILMELND